jgi:hypothetical protein
MTRTIEAAGTVPAFFSFNAEMSVVYFLTFTEIELRRRIRILADISGNWRWLNLDE